MHQNPSKPPKNLPPAKKENAKKRQLKQQLHQKAKPLKPQEAPAPVYYTDFAQDFNDLGPLPTQFPLQGKLHPSLTY